MTTQAKEQREKYSGASLSDYVARLAGVAISVPVDCDLRSFGAGYAKALEDIEAAVLFEREECARVAESLGVPGHTVSSATAQSIAKVIRKRSG